MSGPLILASLWALAALGVAFLPPRAQIVPGGALVAAFPGVIGALALEHGALAAAVGALAVLPLVVRPLWVALRRPAPGREGRR